MSGPPREATERFSKSGEQSSNQCPISCLWPGAATLNGSSPYRDLVLGHAHGQSEFNSRKLAVVGEHPTFEPDDKKYPQAVAAADLIASTWSDYHGGRAAVTHLLNTALWRVSLIPTR